MSSKEKYEARYEVESGLSFREKVDLCACAAHMVNKAYCMAIGDYSQVSWQDAPDWQKASAINGVLGVLDGNTPEQSHESWLAEKEATGWKYGPVKNVEKKEHPCFVEYNQLPTEQKLKDLLFVSTVQAMWIELHPGL